MSFQSALLIVSKSDDIIGKRAVDGGWHECAKLTYGVVGVAGAAGAIAHRGYLTVNRVVSKTHVRGGDLAIAISDFFQLAVLEIAMGFDLAFGISNFIQATCEIVSIKFLPSIGIGFSC